MMGSRGWLSLWIIIPFRPIRKSQWWRLFAVASPGGFDCRQGGREADRQ
jgi:hypothetical protein